MCKRGGVSMKGNYLWLALLLSLAWQCPAIEITPDTVFTSSNESVDTGAKFIIKNTSQVDTIFVDTILFHRMSSVRFGGGIAFCDTAHHYVYHVNPAMENDSFFIATSSFYWWITCSGNCKVFDTRRLLLPPRDSLVLTNTTLRVLVSAVADKAANILPDQCILKAIFVPNKGSRDSVIFVGPQIVDGIKQGVRSNVPKAVKQTSAIRFYDLSGRCVDKVSFRKSGVYISTYGQGILEKKVMFGE
jgi:hypothetical protein